MYYVYLLRSLKNSEKTYVGFSTDLQQRLAKHDSGGCPHTFEYRPWRLVAYTAFDDKGKALKFEKYLKVGSGYSFAKRHLW